MRAAIAAAIAAVAIAASVLPAVADPDDDAARVDSQLSEVGDDLEQANAKVADAMAALSEAQGKLPAAQRVLAGAERAQKEAKEASDAAAAALAEANAAAEQAEEERRKVERQISEIQGRVGNLARDVYQNGAFSDFDLLLTSQSPTDLADRAAALDAVSRANNMTLAQAAAARADLALQEARLQVLRDEVEETKRVAAGALVRAEDARKAAVEAKKEVDRLVEARARALRVADEERKAVLRQYRSLEAEQRRIHDLLAAEAARLAGGGNLGFTPTGTNGFTWPITGGSVGQDIGPRIHPVYGYRSCHTGVDIGAPTGTPIHSTAAGLVVATQSGGPFGNHTLIAHGNGVFSMYAHQSRFGASVGDEVKAGQVIGYVGSTGWSTGPHLHFEMHVGSTPYNPIGWFGGPKVPVTC